MGESFPQPSRPKQKKEEEGNRSAYCHSEHGEGVQQKETKGSTQMWGGGVWGAGYGASHPNRASSVFIPWGVSEGLCPSCVLLVGNPRAHATVLSWGEPVGLAAHYRKWQFRK